MIQRMKTTTQNKNRKLKMRPSVMNNRILTLGIAWASLLTAQADVGPIDFETTGDLTNNFRLAANGYLISQTSFGTLINDYVVHNNNPFNSNGGTVGVYDLTPGDGATTQNLFGGQLKIEFDISAAQPATSFGVLLLDPANPNNNLLALLNLDNNLGTNETIRFFRDGNLPSAGTLVGSPVNGDGGVSISPDSDPVWGHVVVDYLPDKGGGIPELTLTVGSLAATSAFDASNALPSAVEVAFRVYDVNGTGTAKLDNFRITQVPEPGSAGLIRLGIGGLIFFLSRRQRSRLSQSAL